MLISSTERTRTPETLQTVRRAASVLELFVEERALSLTEVMRALRIGQTVAYRLLQTWVQLEYLRFDPATKRYRAGTHLLEIGTRVRARISTHDIEQRLDDVVARLPGSYNIAILQGTRVYYIARRGFDTPALDRGLGSSMPAHATVLGQTILAFRPEEEVEARYPGRVLPGDAPAGAPADFDALLARLRQIRESGSAWGLRSIPGTGCIAVPLRDPAGQVVAGLGAAVPTDASWPESTLDRVLPVLLEASQTPVELPPVFGR